MSDQSKNPEVLIANVPYSEAILKRYASMTLDATQKWRLNGLISLKRNNGLVNETAQKLGIAPEELIRWCELITQEGPVALVIGPASLTPYQPRLNDNEVEHLQKIATGMRGDRRKAAALILKLNNSEYPPDVAREGNIGLGLLSAYVASIDKILLNGGEAIRGLKSQLEAIGYSADNFNGLSRSHRC
jgi:hypothetical protein